MKDRLSNEQRVPSSSYSACMAKNMLMKIIKKPVQDQMWRALVSGLWHLLQAINWQAGLNDSNACSNCHNMTWIQIRGRFKSKLPMRLKNVFHCWYRRAGENEVITVLWLQMLWNKYIQYIWCPSVIFKSITKKRSVWQHEKMISVLRVGR